MSKYQGSKYRHIVGTVQKKELWYPDIKPTTSSDYNTIAASALWVAVAWNNNGIGILGLDQLGKRPSLEVPLIHGHSSAITDLAFSPFNDSILASASEDCTVKVWEIPAEMKEKSTFSDIKTNLSGHKKRVDSLAFHPTASNILATGSQDKTIKVWDLESGKERLTLPEHGDAVQSISWDYEGSLLASMSKDGKLRIIDPRANQITQMVEAHPGVKPNRVAWLGSTNKIATTGFNKMRERQFGLWDARNIATPSKMTRLDTSTGIIDLFYDNDSSLLVLAGKGDGGIRLVEIESEASKTFTDLAPVQTDAPQKSTTVIPKRAVDLMNTEVIRVLRLTANAIAPVSYSVPRKTKSEFQEDLYPPTASLVPAMTGEEWFGGATKRPNLIQLKPSSNPYKFWESPKEESSKEESSSSSYPSSSSSGPASTPSTPKESPAEPKKVVKVVRSSKYRHIVGKGTPKKEQSYNNLSPATAANSSVIRANAQLFCIPWAGAGGRVAILPIGKVGRIVDPCMIECGSDCLDFDWNPFDDYMLATVNEAAVIQIWKLPSSGLPTTPIREATSSLRGHTRRVTSVDFHPTASNVVITTAGDNTMRLWDIEKGSEQLKFEGFTDMVQSISWNWTGSLAATSCKDKLLRLVDPRASKLISSAQSHDGAKGFKLTWMGSREMICTAGQAKSSERQISIWDLKNMSKPLATVAIDNGSGLLTPYYDDTGVVFLAGRGDGNIKMYELETEEPYIHFLTEYGSTIPAQGVALLPKTTCNVRDVEIARFLKLADNYVEPLYFSVPRTKTEFFQDDVYTETRDRKPALSASDWFSGMTKDPVMISLRPPGMSLLSEQVFEKKGPKYDPKAKQILDEDQIKEQVLNSYFQKMGTQKEETKQVLKQDLMEGVDASEWD